MSDPVLVLASRGSFVLKERKEPCWLQYIVTEESMPVRAHARQSRSGYNSRTWGYSTVGTRTRQQGLACLRGSAGVISHTQSPRPRKPTPDHRKTPILHKTHKTHKTHKKHKTHNTPTQPTPTQPSAGPTCHQPTETDTGRLRGALACIGHRLLVNRRRELTQPPGLWRHSASSKARNNSSPDQGPTATIRSIDTTGETHRIKQQGRHTDQTLPSLITVGSRLGTHGGLKVHPWERPKPDGFERAHLLEVPSLNHTQLHHNYSGVKTTHHKHKHPHYQKRRGYNRSFCHKNEL